ncbi:MAG: GTP-binding protein [Oscillospiraceae bacterium]|nr:GTP-binding protein [Oscillospiraceae bacterium]
MKFITFSGPPSCGKTSVILRLGEVLKESFGVVKFDCFTSFDSRIYDKAGIPNQTGISGTLCPDHFFVSNIDACLKWGERNRLLLLISESAGLCNRCSPHIQNIPAVCVIDVLSGVGAPQKIGPMLKLADIVVITKGDLVSQAEREVFALHTIRANPRAEIYAVNGLTGQGIFALAAALKRRCVPVGAEPLRLRFSMPAAICSYCFGETQVGSRYSTGTIKQMRFTDQDQGERL